MAACRRSNINTTAQSGDTKGRTRMTTLNIRRVGDHDLALPAQMSAGAAGFDLRAAESVKLYPGQRRVIPTGFSWEIPDEFAGQVWPRSGLAVNHGIDTLAGLIDSDYRGEIKVVLINHGDEPFDVNKGDRIAQLVLTLFVRAQTYERVLLSETARGENGFASTGLN